MADRVEAPGAWKQIRRLPNTYISDPTDKVKLLYELQHDEKGSRVGRMSVIKPDSIASKDAPQPRTYCSCSSLGAGKAALVLELITA